MRDRAASAAPASPLAVPSQTVIPHAGLSTAAFALPTQHRREHIADEGTQLEVALQRAVAVQVACAKAKKGTEGEARDAARAELEDADAQVDAARCALRRHCIRATSRYLESEARLARQAYSDSQRQTRSMIETARSDAPALARAERRDEDVAIAAEVKDDTRRALQTLEADRQFLRMLEMRADDPTFQQRVALKVANPDPPPLQLKPWAIVGAGRAGIPKLGSMTGPQPDLLNYKTIKRVAQHRVGGRAVFEQDGAGAVVVRIEAVQVAHPQVPPHPTGDKVEAAYLVRNDSTATTYARTGNAKWTTGERLSGLRTGASIRPQRWVGHFSRPYESFDAIRDEADAKAQVLLRQAEAADLAERRAIVDTKLKNGQTKADIAAELISRSETTVPPQPQAQSVFDPHGRPVGKAGRPYSASPAAGRAEAYPPTSNRRPSSAHPKSIRPRTPFASLNSATNARASSARTMPTRPISARSTASTSPRSPRFDVNDTEALLKTLEERRRRAKASGLRELSNRFDASYHLGNMPQWAYVKQ